MVEVIMDQIIDKLIQIAKNEVGTREGSVNNTGARVVEYQGATWLQPGAWPWCAAFTCWIMREWLQDEAVRQRLNIATFSLAEKWRCRDASAFGWEKWAAQTGLTVLSENHNAQAGDFVVYDFSHIGIVIQDQLSVKDNIVTVEGNTNGRGDRDSTSGDGVWDKARNPSLVRCYIRILNSQEG